MFLDWKIQYYKVLTFLLNCSFDAIAIKIPYIFFMEIGNLILKFMWKGNKSNTPKIIGKIIKRKTKLEDSYYQILRSIVKLK